MGGVRRVAVGITGGIAAYKIPPLVRLLRKSGCEVKVVMTEAAKPLVGAETLRTLSGNPVYFDGESRYDMDHIRLSDWADVLLISPATANTIAKIAHGIGDNLLTTLALSIPEERIMIAPAMNSVMWANRATRANVAALKSRGITVLPVEEGPLACGESGPGRMLRIEEIVRHLMAHKVLSTKKLKRTGSTIGELAGDDFSDDVSPADHSYFGGDDPADTPRPSAKKVSGDGTPIGKLAGSNSSYGILAGKRVLISSGPTEEPIDPVRVITNKSSGKMGAALARAALAMGARVTVVSGPAAEPLPPGAEVIPVKTAVDMERAMTERWSASDVCVMAAAVSDYRVVNPSAEKIHRDAGGNITLELAPNPDILAKLGASKSAQQYLVGFSLESGGEGGGDGGIERAEEKMKRKGCDMMVCNRAEAALGTDTTEFTLLFSNGRRHDFSVMGKDIAAKTILTNIAGRMVFNVK